MAHVLTSAAIDAHLRVQKIDVADLKVALAKGLDDFLARPSHAIFLSIIYPVVGLNDVRAALGGAMMPLAFPIVAGFALVGPFAGVGLYEISRRREQGLDCSAGPVLFDIFQSSALGAIAMLGTTLMVIFVVWLAIAQQLFRTFFGDMAPASAAAFVHDLATTPAGHMLIVVGNGVGFLFALLVLAMSVVSFPLLLDREVGAVVALLTSVRAVLRNPLPMAAWGLIVAGLLLIGSLPMFIGLAVVMPILGHSTWHLYRAVVVPEESRVREPDTSPVPRQVRYAAQFPATLFAGENRR
jgi:uncharacterized membrane protein